MNAAPGLGWEGCYGEALREHLETTEGTGDPESSLLRAYQLGRRSLREGQGVVAMVLGHSEALAGLAKKGDTEPTAAVIEQAGAFLAEAMAPYEMVHRALEDATVGLHHLHDFVENEAKRMAAAMHDGAAQLLAASHMQLDMLADEVPTAALPRLKEARLLLDEVEAQLRDLAHELRPTILDDLGLTPALVALVEGFGRRTGLEVKLVAREGRRLPPTIETGIYRVVQEGLNNVRRHAVAKSVVVEVRDLTNSAYCRVQDDGKGFDLNRSGRRNGGGLGLLSIRERVQSLGGFFECKSEVGKGTSLHVLLPVPEGDETDGDSNSIG